MARKTLLLIRGLSHSGTTILDLALGSHPRMIGLGEALRILRTLLHQVRSNVVLLVLGLNYAISVCVHVAPLRPVVLFGVPCLIGCPFMTICP